ncbi:MAG: glycosyltransferase [Anaerolineaceae bacterium]
MIVCYFGTYREEYSRNKIMMAALTSAGVEIKECHETLWHGFEDRAEVTVGGWRTPGFWWRVIRTYCKLIGKYLHIGDYDVMMVGYPGQVDVFLARFLTNLKRKPLVWDVFMSLYLIATERKLDKAKNSSVNLIRKIEASALKEPDMLIQDTAEYVEWFEKNYGIAPERFRKIPTGADDRIFQPVPASKHEDGLMHVLYYGTFIPNHGVGLIIEAVEILRDEQAIVFDLIGDGPDRKASEEFVRAKGLGNVRFYNWMDQNALLTWIGNADMCLGAFGDTPQSLMTVQNKIYECMAAGKAVITGESPATRAQFTNMQDLILCERNPESLANAILLLSENPEMREQIGANALLKFQSNYSLTSLGKSLLDYLSELHA